MRERSGIKRWKALLALFFGGALVTTIAVFPRIDPANRILSVKEPRNPSIVTESALDPRELATRWVVTPAQAKALIERGATILDARDSPWLPGKRIEGAISVRWQQFSRTGAVDRGKLLADEIPLAEKLREAGVFNDKPVVVVADPVNGWGEDGRIVWMLRSLGHRRAFLVDGGYQALLGTGVRGDRTSPRRGDFRIQRTEEWEIDREGLRAVLDEPGWIALDVREEREFRGETPYGERRGGHIPGAIHLYYRDLLDGDGRILPRSKIIAKLQALGVSADSRIVAYCTAGIRAAWVTSVLSDAGFTVKNYAGSMLEWSASPPRDYPMIAFR